MEITLSLHWATNHSESTALWFIFSYLFSLGHKHHMHSLIDGSAKADWSLQKERIKKHVTYYYFL